MSDYPRQPIRKPLPNFRRCASCGAMDAREFSDPAEACKAWNDLRRAHAAGEAA